MREVFFFFNLSDKLKNLLDICFSMSQIYELTKATVVVLLHNSYIPPTALAYYFLHVKADPLHEYHLQDSELLAYANV